MQRQPVRNFRNTGSQHIWGASTAPESRDALKRLSDWASQSEAARQPLEPEALDKAVA